jgi:hypothetical protein
VDRLVVKTMIGDLLNAHDIRRQLASAFKTNVPFAEGAGNQATERMCNQRVKDNAFHLVVFRCRNFSLAFSNCDLDL